MKTILMWVVLIVSLISCQMKTETTANKSTLLPEITMSCKEGNSTTELWVINVRGENLSYTVNEKKGAAVLSDEERSEIEELLETNKAHKIKTKAVASNEKKEWLSVYISSTNFHVQCVESFNYKLTKKSRKRVSSIKTRLVEMVKARANFQPSELAMLAEK